jgi:hypothetical protein
MSGLVFSTVLVTLPIEGVRQTDGVDAIVGQDDYPVSCCWVLFEETVAWSYPGEKHLGSGGIPCVLQNFVGMVGGIGRMRLAAASSWVGICWWGAANRPAGTGGGSSERANVCCDRPGDATIAATHRGRWHDKRLNGHLIWQCREVEEGPLDNVHLDAAIGRRRRRCIRIAKKGREVIVGDSPNVGENDHEGCTANLWLVLVFALEDRRPLMEAVQNLGLVGQHSSNLQHHAVGL